MLNALGCTDDDGNTLKEDGVRGAKTIQAIHRFQAANYPDCPAEQAPLAPSDKLGVAGRKEMFLAYAKRVSRQPVDPARLSTIGSAKFMGCGEYNPLSLTIKDAESRRAVVFVYGAAAEPQGLPCALQSTGPCKSNCGPLATVPDPDGKPPYRCKVYQSVAKKCPCSPGPDLTRDLVLRLPYTMNQAATLHHVFTLTSDDGTVSQRRTLSGDARSTDDARVDICFLRLSEIHAYTLSSDDGQSTYTLFENIPYDQLQDAVRPPPRPNKLGAHVAVEPSQNPPDIGAASQDNG